MWISLLVADSVELDKFTRNSFIARSRLVENCFNRKLVARSVRLKGVKKITITLTTSNITEPVITGPMKGYSPVCNIRVGYDFNVYKSLPEVKMNDAISQIIGSSVSAAVKRMNWSSHALLSAVQEVISEGCASEYFAGKVKWSPDRTHKAGILVNYGLEDVTLNAAFLDNRNNICLKVELARILPYALFLGRFLGKAKWRNRNEFELADQLGEVTYVASRDGRVRIELSPRGKTEDQLIDELLIHLPTTGKDRILKILEDRIKSHLN